MTRHVIVLPFAKPPVSSNARLHHHEKARLTRLIRQSATQCARAAQIPPQGKSAVTTVWYPPDRRRRDAGSLAPTGKAAIDGLVDAGIWPDDDPQHVAEERYRIGPINRTNPHIEIWIDPETHCFVCHTDNPPPQPDGCGPQCLKETP